MVNINNITIRGSLKRLVTQNYDFSRLLEIDLGGTTGDLENNRRPGNRHVSPIHTSIIVMYATGFSIPLGF